MHLFQGNVKPVFPHCCSKFEVVDALVLDEGLAALKSLKSLFEGSRRGKTQQPTPQGEDKAAADRRQTSDCHPV